MLRREDIRIRDPFILTDTEQGCYYMYGTTDLVPGSLHTGCTFSVYKTTDLQHFEQPKVIFDAKAINFWADADFWAPEVHRYNGKYYLFGSCYRKDSHRGTQIFVCDTPDGIFTPLSPRPVTPADWECLDGTLWVENGTPYIIFCREWLQVQDGEIHAMPLTPDLRAAAGEPVLLFRASDHPEVTPLAKRPGCYITDGPFVFADGGRLHLIWSSIHQGRYLVLEATASNITGPWQHGKSSFDFDGGHAMVFHTLQGERYISLHAPNRPDAERPLFLKY